MTVKLIVEINPDGEECGPCDCRYLEEDYYTGEADGWACEMFGKKVGLNRLLECLEAQRLYESIFEVGKERRVG